MNINYNYELDEIDPNWGELEERQRLFNECAICSMADSEFRLYINNKIDIVILYLKSIKDVLNQQGEHSK